MISHLLFIFQNHLQVKLESQDIFLLVKRREALSKFLYVPYTEMIEER